MVPDFSRSWYWTCPVCPVEKQACSQQDARRLADEHDKATHKSKPLTSFGWGHVPPAAENRALTVEFLRLREASATEDLEDAMLSRAEVLREQMSDTERAEENRLAREWNQKRLSAPEPSKMER